MRMVSDGRGLFYWATNDSRLWPTLDWGVAIALQVLLIVVAIGMISGWGARPALPMPRGASHPRQVLLFCWPPLMLTKRRSAPDRREHRAASGVAGWVSASDVYRDGAGVDVGFHSRAASALLRPSQASCDGRPYPCS